MTATSADVARFTNDGVLLTARDTAIRDQNAGSEDLSDEIITFFDNEEAGQAMLDERFALVSMLGRMHEAIEIEDNMGLGLTLPIVPFIPHFYVIDESRALAGRAALRAYSFDHNNDRYALELTGTPVPVPPGGHVTMDDTDTTFDDTSHSMDES